VRLKPTEMFLIWQIDDRSFFGHRMQAHSKGSVPAPSSK
jgi:hypothetical protein